MNPSLLWVGGCCSLGLALIVWLVAGPIGSQTAVSRAANTELESLFVLHCRYFAQVRQVLGEDDARFLRGRLSPSELAEWTRERRQVLERFLAALGEDYARLDYLSRRVAVLAPHIRRTNEFERIWLGVRFRILYRVVSMRLAVKGLVPVGSIAGLTGVLGALSCHLEGGMSDLERAADLVGNEVSS